jgi:hypothetical protein
LNVDWRPYQAYQRASIGSKMLTEIMCSEFYLGKCWSSNDNRISAREGTTVCNSSNYDSKDFLRYSTEVSTIATIFSEAMRIDPYGLSSKRLDTVKVASIPELTFDHFQQLWSCEAIDSNDNLFTIAFEANPNNKDSIACFKRHFKAAVALFGLWYVAANGTLTVKPISLFTCQECHSLSFPKRSTHGNQ